MQKNNIGFYFRNKKYASKLKAILTKFEKKKIISTPFTFDKCNSLVVNFTPGDAKILRKHFTPKLKLLEIWNKCNGGSKKNKYFNKNLEVCSWKSFFEL